MKRSDLIPQRLGDFRIKHSVLVGASFKSSNLFVPSPGDDRQLLGLLRAAKCDVSKAVEVAEAFVDFLDYFEDATPSKMVSTLEYFSKVGMKVPDSHESMH